METEDNSIQRQIYYSSIIYVGHALSIQNDFLTLYCHKKLHHTQSGGRGLPLVWLIYFLCKTLPNRLKFNKISIHMFKVERRALGQGVKYVQS